MIKRFADLAKRFSFTKYLHALDTPSTNIRYTQCTYNCERLNEEGMYNEEEIVCRQRQ